MRIDRLKTLLKFLHENVDDTHYDHGAWGSIESCGTVGCAGGWATQIPEFQAEGFGALGTIGIRSFAPVFRDVDFPNGMAYGDTALKLFFELSYDQVNEIFHYRGYTKYPTLEDVKRKIGDVITAESLRLSELAATPALPEVMPDTPGTPEMPDSEDAPR